MGFSRTFGETIERTGEERATLVRRTYGLVLVSVFTTILGAAFVLTQPELMGSMARHPFLSIIAVFAPLFMAQRFYNVFPHNILLTLLFTFVMGAFVGPYLAFAEQRTPGVIGQAGILTLSTFGVLTAYATLSKRDFSAWGAFFTVGLWVLIASSLLNFFFQSTLASLYISAGTVLVFSGLLVFDTWRIVKSGQFGPDDYVIAAVKIYLDLMNIFLAIVNLLGGRRRG